MCHDGASETTTVGETTDEEPSNAQVEQLRRNQYRAMIFSLIYRGYNVALINGLEFIDTKVRSMSNLSSFADKGPLLGAGYGCRRIP